MRLKLEFAPDVKRPNLPRIPSRALTEAGGTQALWRGRCADGSIVALAGAKVTRGMRILKDEVLVVVAGKEGELRASFDMGPKRTPWPFRHVMDIHPDGLTFLYAYGPMLFELDLRGAPALVERYTLPEDHQPPFEAVYLGDGAVFSSEDRLTLLEKGWREKQVVPVQDIGYFHLGRMGELLITACYDTDTTPAGPTFRPDIVVYRLQDSRLVEIARCKGPGRNPFVFDGKLYVQHKRKIHRVLGLPSGAGV